MADSTLNRLNNTSSFLCLSHVVINSWISLMCGGLIYPQRFMCLCFPGTFVTFITSFIQIIGAELFRLLTSKTFHLFPPNRIPMFVLLHIQWNKWLEATWRTNTFYTFLHLGTQYGIYSTSIQYIPGTWLFPPFCVMKILQSTWNIRAERYPVFHLLYGTVLNHGQPGLWLPPQS